MNNALPPYVFLPTGLFLAKLIAHKEGEDRSKWVTDFAVQLVEGTGRDDFARSLIDTAVIKQNAAMNRVRRSRAKSELISEGVKNPTRQQIEERLKEIYAEEEITAAAATREGADVPTIGCNNSQDAPNGNAGVDVSDAGNGAASKSPTSCDTFTADGDTREDSQAIHDGSAITRNETRLHDALEPSANIYGPRQAKNGDAATREGAEVVSTRESGAFAPTTVSNNSQVAPTRKAGEFETDSGDAGKLESATACNHYDQEATISTNEDRQIQARESQGRAGGNSLRVAKVSTPPARSALSKKAHGEFGNVLLTDDEFSKLTEKLPNVLDLIDELDQYIESRGKTGKYKSHYATLLNWSRRKAQESKPKQGYKNINDINRETYEKSKREIHAMFHPEEAKAV